MVQKLSNFLGTSFSENPVDSAGIVTIIGATTILLDSGTSGNYVRTLSAGPGFNLPSAAHSLDATLTVDSSYIATVAGTTTLTNKTINLSNNTLVATLSQLSAAVSGDTVIGAQATQTLTNKTLTSPTINGADINGPLSINDITTFGLRDVTTSDYETLIVSNNASPALSADRTLTLDINNADRTISLTGNLTLAGSLTTSGAHATTLTTTGTTGVTLPTSGTLVSKDGSGDFSAGLITADFNRSGNTTVTAGTYGSAALVPVMTVDSSGFIDSIGTVSVAGVSSVVFDSATQNYTINTADGGSYAKMIHIRKSAGIASSAYGSASLVPVIKVDDFGHIDSIGTVSVAGVSSTSFDSGTGALTINTADGGSFVQPVYTQELSRTAVSGGFGLAYNNTSGILSVDSSELNAYFGGTGKGLDADKLDGQHGSHYRIDVYNAAGTLLN